MPLIQSQPAYDKLQFRAFVVFRISIKNQALKYKNDALLMPALLQYTLIVSFWIILCYKSHLFSISALGKSPKAMNNYD